MRCELRFDRKNLNKSNNKVDDCEETVGSEQSKNIVQV